MVSFAAPLWLALLPLPLLLWIIASRKPRTASDSPALRHPQAERLIQLQAALDQRRRLPWLWLAGATLLVLALARPQWLETQQESRNFILAIDVSGSMRALDFTIDGQPVSRLDMVKRVVSDFMERRRGDRIGLIVFADDAFTLTPLSSDHRLIQQFLADVKNGMAGEKTALGQAIALGVKRLLNQEPGSRALILLTDGTQSSGTISPQSALVMARAEGVRVYAIGIGSHGKVLFPRGPREKPDYKEVPLDEAYLQQLAGETGGRYYRATATEELARIVADVEKVETTRVPLDPHQIRNEGYPAPLLLGLALITLALMRGETRVAP